jgi:hypothetical protein
MFEIVHFAADPRQPDALAPSSPSSNTSPREFREASEAPKQAKQKCLACNTVVSRGIPGLSDSEHLSPPVDGSRSNCCYQAFTQVCAVCSPANPRPLPLSHSARRSPRRRATANSTQDLLVPAALSIHFALHPLCSASTQLSVSDGTGVTACRNNSPEGFICDAKFRPGHTSHQLPAES